MELSLAERRLLAALPSDGTPMEAAEAAEAAGFHAAGEALRAAGGPHRHGLLQIHEDTIQSAARTAEGERALHEGLPERRAVGAIAEAGGRLSMPGLAEAIGPDARIAVGWLKRKGWATMEKSDEGTLLVLAGDAPPGDDEAQLESLAGDVAGLAQRGLVDIAETTVRRLALTEQGIAVLPNLGPLEGEEVNQVTPDLIARWADDPQLAATTHLRRFDFDVEVAPRFPGKIHPLTQIILEVRDVFRSMGFQEIAGDYVESAFWNMDALFIPQDHPARDMQDTFYLDEPATQPVDDADLARGKDIHETGGATGSTGWGGAFDEGVARKALLRTHTTNTTVKYLRDAPGGSHKVFGVGRVFRKETMDATHLPEFTQIEGIVTEPGASFDMLVGLCREFFTRMGFPEVRLRPAYFPYTEPSMEVDVMWNGKWMELGGSGIFRPEVTHPLGVKHPVLAWGFGLERLAMMRLGLKDIRELYVSDVQWLRENPLQ